MKKLNVVGKFKDKTESTSLNYDGSVEGIKEFEKDAIREGKQYIAVKMFGLSKNPPFSKRAYDLIEKIEWKIEWIK